MKAQIIFFKNDVNHLNFIFHAEDRCGFKIKINIDIICRHLYYRISELGHRLCLPNFTYKVTPIDKYTQKIIFSSTEDNSNICFTLNNGLLNRLLASKIFNQGY